ncbi:MAG TPA: methyltransferase [Archangium sp.]|nr:methyltransferase [Archangium sp.]
MSAFTASRILFVFLLLNEAIVVARTPPAERERVILPRGTPLPILLLLAPFFFVLELPGGWGWGAVFVQAVGLGMELAGEIQLTRARSFSMAANRPAHHLTTGLYRYLENPIYLGLLLQIIAWSLWMPLAFVAVALQLEAFRRMVGEERRYLGQLAVVHRGADSFLWN